MVKKMRNSAPSSLPTFTKAPHAEDLLGAACGFYLDAGKSDRFLSKLFAIWENRLVKDITAGVIKAAVQTLYPKPGRQ